MAKRSALGRGLGALLGDAAPLRETQEIRRIVNGNPAAVAEIPVGQIVPNPYQPREDFDPESLAELADSIRTLGIIQPLTLRRTAPDSYQIISGERRYRAAIAAGLTSVPAYVRQADDAAMLEMAIVENIQREDLDPIETALSFQRLIDECHLTQEEMADRVGKKRASVTNTIRLLKLPAKVQHDLKVGLLSVGHAKVILGIEDPQAQEDLCDLVIKEGLSVRQLETEVAKLLKGGRKPAGPRKEQELPDEYVQVLGHIGKFFSNDISLKRSSSGKGSMTIHFSSDDEVHAFLKALEDAGI